MVMPITFRTYKIKKDRYKVLIERQIYVNLGVSKGKDFIKNWDILIHPLEDSEKYKQYYDHVEGETNIGIAWGVTMPSEDKHGKIICFINDKDNVFILRSNFTKISHELAHGILYALKGRSRCIRKYDEPGAKKGTEAACYVTQVHDQFYGKKQFRTYWIRYGLAWVPVQMLDVYDIINT
jgi:hypothetical protein